MTSKDPRQKTDGNRKEEPTRGLGSDEQNPDASTGQRISRRRFGVTGIRYIAGVAIIGVIGASSPAFGAVCNTGSPDSTCGKGSPDENCNDGSGGKTADVDNNCGFVSGGNSDPDDGCRAGKIPSGGSPADADNNCGNNNDVDNDCSVNQQGQSCGLFDFTSWDSDQNCGSKDAKGSLDCSPDIEVRGIDPSRLGPIWPEP